MRSKLLAIGVLILMFAVTVGIELATAQPAISPSLTLQAAGAADQDDMTFWLHPTDLSRSTIITSDKSANKLFVYDLAGKTLQVIAAEQPGNVDTRYGFRLGGELVDVVAFNERKTNKIRVYKVNPLTRQLEQIDDGRIDSGPNYGFTLYKSPGTGRFYAFTSPHSGWWQRLFGALRVKQFELVDAGGGRVTALGPLRELRLGSTVEGMVADDEERKLYVAEESVGVWKFDAEPTGAASGTQIAAVAENGLTADVEGLALYHMPNGHGYLIASSQGNSTFAVYERKSPHRFLGAFAIDGVAHTDGIEVVNLPLNAGLSQGVFASHNGRASPHPVQIVKWDDIARALKLRVDVAYWDPRKGTPGDLPATLVASGPAERTPAHAAAAVADDTRKASARSDPPVGGSNAERRLLAVTAALVAAGKVKDDEGRFRVRVRCGDNLAAGVTTTADLNGIPVVDGQIVKLEIDDENEVKRKKNGVLKIEAPAFRLGVACRDSAGNVGTAAATPAFRS